MISEAGLRFINYIGELGGRWGLPATACRVHAYLYLRDGAASSATIAEDMSLDAADVAIALDFLNDFAMLIPVATDTWKTSSDPWDMLASGLEQRRQRELPEALATLRACHREALSDHTTAPATATQIRKMLALAENLSALGEQMQRISPQLLKSVLNASGRAAGLIDQILGSKRGAKP